MPEGPEVETIRRGLSETIVGQRIARIDVLTPKTFDLPAGFIDEVTRGQEVLLVERLAKVLIWHLANQYSLLFHLKMTGQVVLERAGGKRYAGGHPSDSMAHELPDKTTRVVFALESGDTVYFNDMRKFGWVKLMPTADITNDELIARLGPEPLSPAFTLVGFAAKVARHKGAPIKAVILDQSTVSGVGNIYADESLHLAKIHPTRTGGDLTKAEVKRLHEAIIAIITLGIEHGGTSFSSYVNSFGGTGNYLDHARVFRREGEPCPVCGTTIVKTRVGGRGTHTCPVCQPVPKLRRK